MKKIRIIMALVLVLGLILCMPFSVQAQEEYREVTLEAAYKINDKQIVFEFSEPIAINVKGPHCDIRLTNRNGYIISKYDEVGNHVGYYLWNLNYEYLNSDHDKIIFTIVTDSYGCDGISDFMGSCGSLPQDLKDGIKSGKYRFMIGMEELYLYNANENMNDGMLKNLVSESDPNVYVWPNRLTAGECAMWWLDELLPKPANMVVDENLFESVSGSGQNWDHDILQLGEELAVEAPEDAQTVVKNDPKKIAIILGGGVVLAAVLITVFVLASKKRKAA